MHACSSQKTELLIIAAFAPHQNYLIAIYKYLIIPAIPENLTTGTTSLITIDWD